MEESVDTNDPALFTWTGIELNELKISPLMWQLNGYENTVLQIFSMGDKVVNDNIPNRTVESSK